MKNSILLLGILSAFAVQSFAKESKMNWSGLSREKIDLKLPLLIIKGSKGFLACGYINVETCNKTEEACAIISGVKTHDDMLGKEIKAVSQNAEKLGIKVGMTGQQALELLK